MGIMRTLTERYGVFKIRAGVVVLLLLLGVGSFFGLRGEEQAVTAGDEPLSVTMAPIATLASGDSRTFVGTIAAVNQAKVQAEAGGRVVSVPVRVGDRVGAGAILAQVENASERASVLQAQGAYEAALAGATQSDSGVRDAETAVISAKNGAVSTLRNAYTTANGVLVSSIDPFFSSPQSSIPGLRVSGPTNYLNPERVAFQTLMPEWQRSVTSANTESDLVALLTKSEADTTRLIAVLDTLIQMTTNRDGDLAGLPVQSYTAGLLSARASLDNAINDLRAAATAITTAEEGLDRARVGGTSATVSVANAQVKQAQGALLQAQAALAKTIIRSPIAGSVSALQIKVGDNIGAGTPVAEIVNEAAYELAIYVNESERSTLSIGQTVMINDTISGTITNIAPALDPRTQKVEVKIAIESRDVLSGSTAIVSLGTSTVATTDTALTVPLTAVAFAVEGGALLTVVDGKVVALPVVLGDIRGNQVAVSGENLSPATEIIVDARGLIVGEVVNVTN